MVNEHNIRVQVLLSADEFVFVRDRSKALGISASAYFRQLAINDRRVLAQEELSASNPSSDTSELTQDMHTILKALAKLAKDYE